tara:strand:- start:1576 stop:1761 length:186 start_codon:yes stop_codon:yes gene_type:complete
MSAIMNTNKNHGKIPSQTHIQTYTKQELPEEKQPSLNMTNELNIYKLPDKTLLLTFVESQE